jgi:hypothetical protein
MAKVEKILDERGSNYGNFHTFSNLSQSLYAIIVTHYNDMNKQREDQPPLPAFMAESLRMICHKLARIANGNPYHTDSWVDIAGYAQLVTQILEAKDVAEAQAAAKAAETLTKSTPEPVVTPLPEPQTEI